MNIIKTDGSSFYCEKTLFFCYFREIIKIDYSDAPTNNEQI